MCVGKVGSAFEAAGQNHAALAEFRKASGIERALAQSDPGNSQARSAYAFTLQSLAAQLAQMGDRAGALAAYREALDIVRQMLAADPQNPRRQARYAGIQKDIRALANSGGR